MPRSLADLMKLPQLQPMPSHDYPTLVPTLTQGEVNMLINLREGAPIPDSIKQKAEAHALARIAKGEPVFAQPGEQNVSIHPHIKRAR